MMNKKKKKSQPSITLKKLRLRKKWLSYKKIRVSSTFQINIIRANSSSQFIGLLHLDFQWTHIIMKISNPNKKWKYQDSKLSLTIKLGKLTYLKSCNLLPKTITVQG